jgi:hypothetical protein
MKDQVLTVIDALLLAKAELNAHMTRRVQDVPLTIARLQAILMDQKVNAAMGTLAPGISDAPSVAPNQEETEARPLVRAT